MEKTKLIYQSSAAFREGYKAGRQDAIDKATEWLFANVYDFLNPKDQYKVEQFRLTMKEE